MFSHQNFHNGLFSHSDQLPQVILNFPPKTDSKSKFKPKTENMEVIKFAICIWATINAILYLLPLSKKIKHFCSFFCSSYNFVWIWLVLRQLRPQIFENCWFIRTPSLQKIFDLKKHFPPIQHHITQGNLILG